MNNCFISCQDIRVVQESGKYGSWMNNTTVQQQSPRKGVEKNPFESVYDGPRQAEKP
jgi:hypothetical protein